MNTKKLKAYIELTKPGITRMVLVMTALGYCLSGSEFAGATKLIYTLIGTALTCGGAGVLNHYLERDTDCKMKRTAHRPIPSGLVSAQDALAIGLLMVFVGTVLLYFQVNLLTAFLALLTAFLYTLVYTPLKKITWLNTFVGAIPGALPPVGGWAAATGSLGLGAWVLFFILFFWQFPHFYAIAWMYKDDYLRGGLKMLPSYDPSGNRTFRQIIIYSVLLLIASVCPSLIGMTGWIYLIGATVLSTMMLGVGVYVYNSRTVLHAKRLMQATIFYLPVLFLFIILDAAIL